MTEIALRFASSVADERLFCRLRLALDRLVEETGDLETAILEETWKLIDCLGFAPTIDRCSLCGEPPHPEEVSFFDIAEGALVCLNCRRQRPGTTLRELPPQASLELIGLLNGVRTATRLMSARFQRTLLREFMSYHLTDERPLKSFRFLDDRLG